MPSSRAGNKWAEVALAEHATDAETGHTPLTRALSASGLRTDRAAIEAPQRLIVLLDSTGTTQDRYQTTLRAFRFPLPSQPRRFGALGANQARQLTSIRLRLRGLGPLRGLVRVEVVGNLPDHRAVTSPTPPHDLRLELQVNDPWQCCCVRSPASMMNVLPPEQNSAGECPLRRRKPEPTYLAAGPSLSTAHRQRDVANPVFRSAYRGSSASRHLIGQRAEESICTIDDQSIA